MYMKNLLTILATVFITVWVMVWGNAIMNSSWSNDGDDGAWNQSIFSKLFSFGRDSDTTKIEWDSWTTNIVEKMWDIKLEWDLILCPENESPELNPLTWEFECIPAAPVVTDCVRHIDGDAYPDGDTQIGYKSAIKDNDNLSPECETVTFTCKEWKYQSTEGELDIYNRGECVIINKTNGELKTCVFNNQEYNMWEEIYTHIKEKVQSDYVCSYAKFKCVASEDLESENGEWYSEFDLDIYQYESCEVSEALSDEYIKENIDELMQEWRVIEEEDENGKIAAIQNISYEPQSLGDEIGCEAFGKEYDHNDSKRFFENKTTAYTTTCNYVSSKCVDGNRQPYSPENFDGIEYPYTTCKIEGPGVCTIWETVLADARSWTFYDYGQINTTTWEWECESQVKYCEAPLDWEGTTHYDTIDGDIAPNNIYIYTSCRQRADYVAPRAAAPVVVPQPTPAPAYDASKAACPSPYIGETAARAAGQKWIWYDVSNIAYGSNDQCSAHAISLQCYFGHVRPVIWGSPGTTKYINNLYRSCSEWSPASCTFDYLDVADINVPHQWTATFYTVSSVEFGDSCSNYLRSSGSVCTNGSLSVASGYKNCVEGKAAACTSPCGAVANGASITTYSTASLPYNPSISSCSAVSNVVTVSTCSNGNFDIVPSKYCSCSVAAPVGCGNGLSHGQTITKNINYDCRDISAWDSLNGEEERVCQCLHGSQTCTNGVLSNTSNRPQVQNWNPGSC